MLNYKQECLHPGTYILLYLNTGKVSKIHENLLNFLHPKPYGYHMNAIMLLLPKRLFDVKKLLLPRFSLVCLSICLYMNETRETYDNQDSGGDRAEPIPTEGAESSVVRNAKYYVGSKRAAYLQAARNKNAISICTARAVILRTRSVELKQTGGLGMLTSGLTTGLTSVPKGKI